MPDLPAVKKRTAAKVLRPFFRNKERNCNGESVLCIEEILLPQLLYIVYQVFRRAQIFVGFFRSRRRPGAAGGFSRAEFLQKNKPCKDAQPDGAMMKKPLLPQIQFNTKCVKLQELNYIYSISYFPPNTTAKPQNCRHCMPLSHPAVSA